MFLSLSLFFLHSFLFGATANASAQATHTFIHQKVLRVLNTAGSSYRIPVTSDGQSVIGAYCLLQDSEITALQAAFFRDHMAWAYACATANQYVGICYKTDRRNEAG